LDDFELGSGAKVRSGPFGLADQAAVEFDGDAGGVNFQLLEQTEYGLTIIGSSQFAVHCDLDGHVG
jgi:hypothetical protein